MPLPAGATKSITGRASSRVIGFSSQLRVWKVILQVISANGGLDAATGPKGY
jgi:hypothetical protein